MTSWKYIKKQPFEKNKNSIQDGFFHSGTEVSALVREAIQNSLDAQLDSNKPVRIKFSIRDKSNALSHAENKKWFGPEAWSHYNSDNNGLVNTPKESDECNYLIFEDFNTTGLNGNIEQDARRKGIENPFYSFFRAEGESGKLNKLGSHGLGKIVFPMCSRIRSIFTLTTRSDDYKTYLVGQSILKFHQIHTTTFHPDGWYGVFREDGFQLPVDNQSVIDDFKDTFKIIRDDNESGLSIIIPWLDEDIKCEEIIKCIVEEYYPSIMSNVLEAEIINNNDEVFPLNYNTLLDSIDQIDGLDSSLKLKINLATDFYTSPLTGELQSKGNLTVLDCPSTKKHEWKKELFLNNSIQKISDDLENGVAIIKVPITIYQKEHNPVDSFFHVILKKTETSIKPTFIRDKLIITSAALYATPGYIAIVIIRDTPLTRFLGHAETPAHTKWDPLSQNFKGRYDYGRELIRYVSLGVKRILENLQSEDEKVDSVALSNFFSIEHKNLDKEGKAKKGEKDTSKVVLPEKIIKGKSYFNESSLSDGFKISGAQDLEFLRKFSIFVAYDLLRGNPFNKWNAADFDLEDMVTDMKHVDNLTFLNNSINFESNNKDFYIKVQGFDTRRDVKVATKSLGSK